MKLQNELQNHGLRFVNLLRSSEAILYLSLHSYSSLLNCWDDTFFTTDNIHYSLLFGHYYIFDLSRTELERSLSEAYSKQVSRCTACDRKSKFLEIKPNDSNLTHYFLQREDVDLPRFNFDYVVASELKVDTSTHGELCF